MCNRSVSHSVHSLYLHFISPSSLFSSPTTHSLPPSPSLFSPPACLHHRLHLPLPRCSASPSVPVTAAGPRCIWVLVVYLQGCLPSLLIAPPADDAFAGSPRPPSTPNGSVRSPSAAGCLCVLVNRSLDCYPGPRDRHLPHPITAPISLPHTSILACTPCPPS